jgi:hypothetical protein
MEVTLWHGIQYDVDAPVAVEDLIKSLEANAKLLQRTGDLLSDLFPGLKFETKSISVVRLSQESPLSELFAYATVMAYQKDLEKAVPHLIEQLTGHHVSAEHETLVTVLVMLIAIQGISKAFDALFPGRDKAAITETKESLVHKVATITGLAAVRIYDALDVLFTGRQNRGTVLASQRVFAPTRGQPKASISARDGTQLMAPDAVSLAQSASGLPYEGTAAEEAPRTSSEFHRNVKIILHAMDKDRKRTGWAGHVPSLFDDRIPMHLEKSQSPETIFGKSEVTGDILLTHEEDENGDMKPKEFLLVQTYLS